MDRCALGGRGDHLDVGVGTLWKIHHDSSDWSNKERERFLAFVTCKRDTGVAHKPQALTVVGGVDLDRTNYS